jgi:hypothetical protein
MIAQQSRPTNASAGEIEVCERRLVVGDGSVEEVVEMHRFSAIVPRFHHYHLNQC